MRWLEHRIPPPLVAIVISWGMHSVARSSPGEFLPEELQALLIGLFLSLAALFFSRSWQAFRAAQTTLNPIHIDQATTLVGNGIYRVSRNPMYVGLTSLEMAWACYLQAPLAFLGLILLAAYLTRFQILPEERALEAKFGQEYRDYQARVPRWL